MMRRSALWMLIRPGSMGLSSVVLPIITFAVVTVSVLGAGSIARLFFVAQDNELNVYKIMASMLIVILLVPVGTLAASAARLSARRRDDRLATLRLLGASSSWVRLVAVAESTLVASVGILAGVLLYLLAAPLLVFFPIQGATPSFSEVWLPWWAVVAAVILFIAVATTSAAIGLRKVIISPLSVRQKTDAPKLSWLRIVIGSIAIAGAFILLQKISGSWGSVGIAAGFSVVVVLVMSVLGVIGPFVIGKLATRQLKHARTAPQLVAARKILESPKAAWRQVSGVALASFALLPVGGFVGFLNLIERSTPTLDAYTRQTFVDIQTIALVAIATTFVLVACSIGVTQAAAVLERRRLYVSLDRIGMPTTEMNQARKLSVIRPLRVATLGSVILSVVLFPMMTIALVVSPQFLLIILALLIGGEIAVRLALVATGPLLENVLSHPERSL